MKVVSFAILLLSVSLPAAIFGKAQDGAILGHEKGAWPPKLNKKLPCESWDGLYRQRGVWFDRVKLAPVDPFAPPLVQPEKMDLRERQTATFWKGEPYFLQNG